MTTYVFEDFEPHAGGVFVLAEEGLPPLEFQLETAERLPARGGPDGMRPPFSLIFRCAEQEVLSQGHYHFAHDEMGKPDIFVVPIGRDEAGVIYQAVFN